MYSNDQFIAILKHMYPYKKKRREGFTLVEIMIVVAIIALLAAIAIPNLLRAKINANQASAQATLKTIANAMENYAAIHNTYPSSTTELTGATPPYLNADYFSGVHNGYSFTSYLSDYMYTITANPAGDNSGNVTYTVSTGGVLKSL